MGETKVVASHLQFWTNRHAEIHGLPQKEAGDDATNPQSTPKKQSTPEVPPSQTFADLDRKCCILCARQFKTEAEVNKHERMSQLHRDNLKNEDLVAKAMAKLKLSISRSNLLHNTTVRKSHLERQLLRMKLKKLQYNQKVRRYWAKWDGLLEKAWGRRAQEEPMRSYLISILKVWD